MTLLQWPYNRDRMWTPRLVGKSISGGRTLSGPMIIGRFDGGGIWMVDAGEVQVSTPDQQRAWRALEGYLDGGANDILVPMREYVTAPFPPLIPPVYALNCRNSDSSACSDGSTWACSLVYVTMLATAVLRATSLTVNVATTGAQLRGGEIFSVVHPTHNHKAYRITTVTANGGNSYTVGIRPPLRDSLNVGQELYFDFPLCVMHLAADNAMDLTTTRRFFGQGALKWVESFPPYNT